MSEYCKIVDAYKDISRKGDENIATGVFPNALALPAGAGVAPNALAPNALVAPNALPAGVAPNALPPGAVVAPNALTLPPGVAPNALALPAPNALALPAGAPTDPNIPASRRASSSSPEV